MNTAQSEVRLKTLVDERELVHQKHEQKLSELASRDNKDATHDDKELLRGYRERLSDFDTEINEMTTEIERAKLADEQSRSIRRILSDGRAGVDVDGEGVVYRDFNAYAFDYLITRQNISEVAKITRQWGVDEDEIKSAKERLSLIKRVPTNTLSSNVGGLTPPQHISQIFQVINASRNLVNAATHADLERGTLTYPQVDTKPVVLVQSAEKTEGGTTGMAISMVTKTASTYLGGGDLSWQAINWSTPNALRLWFDLVAADYALKTETDAATIVSASGFLNNISSTIGATPTFADLMTAVGAGYAEVWANSGRTANSIIMAPDRFGYMLGLTSAAYSQFVSVDQQGVGPLRVIVSRGLNAGEIIVGDVSALLCAETPGAPVEMQVVEPSIGGVEVGLIGAFEAAVTDNGAFATITTAS
jgi:HK97 family phage major capsid protein